MQFTQPFDSFETETTALVLRHSPCFGARSSHYIPKNNITSIGYVRDWSLLVTMFFTILIILCFGVIGDKQSSHQERQDGIAILVISLMGFAWQMCQFFIRKIMIHAGTLFYIGKFDDEKCADLLQWYQNSLTLGENIV